ncbi:MAG: energy transducer TonB [Proteobacteria bacterium]|nr:energy transducer TonB [Pseudomonadota bacterium]
MTAIAVGRADPARWAACFALVFALHAGGAWLVSRLRPAIEPLPVDLSSVVMIDLAPLPAPAPSALVEPEPVRAALPELEPTPVAQAAVPLPPRPVRRPAPFAERAVPETPAERTEPAVAPVAGPPASAPVPPRATAVPPGAAIASWQSQLLARLESFKRYPAEARARREAGVASVRFVVDRDGRVHSATLQATSGSRSLDAEAVEIVRRAEPLPKPPPEIAGERIELVVPVNFAMCRTMRDCR